MAIPIEKTAHHGPCGKGSSSVFRPRSGIVSGQPAILSWLLTLLTVAPAFGPLRAQEAEKKEEPEKVEAASTPEKEEARDEPSVTHHSLLIDGKELRYTATAGFIVLHKLETDEKKREKNADADGLKPVAKLFYIAYTKDGESDPAKRPLMFSFNGGPGASSIWLHMGGLGPKRTVFTERGEGLPPPARYEDNPLTWLDETDLVFVDPVSTGFSRAAPGEDPKQFHGYRQDIESVAEFIRLYLTRNERWASPKFVIGESYGTTRAAGLSEYLQDRHGIVLNGVVLASAVLNFQTIDASPGNDTAYPLFLPSFAAVAWYHKKLSPDLQSKPLEDVLAKAEEFASGDYVLALFRGETDVEKKHEIARRMEGSLGVPAAYIVLRDLRVQPSEFMSHLLRGDGKMVGRFDGRFSGPRFEPGTDGTDFDPSFETVKGPFTATFNDYVRRELRFESPLEYETLANVWPWKFAREDNQYLDTAEDLRRAMLKNPHLKVWICGGYYDLATPYFAAEQTVKQMALPKPIRENFTTTNYPAGHMLYLDESVLRAWKSDFVKFLESALQPDTATIENAAR